MRPSDIVTGPDAVPPGGYPAGGFESTPIPAALAEAVDLAREAAEADAGEGMVGEHVGVQPEDAAAATHLFEATYAGYVGWRWAVTVATSGPDDPVTISEVVLLPGPDALTAPDWVPWQQRVQAGDLGVGDLLVTPKDDPRLVPAYLENDDPAVEDVTRELGLGRVRVLSRGGRAETAERWREHEYGPRSDMARSAPATCGTCGFYLPVAGSLSAAFGVCANEMAPADGHVVHVEYGCGAHSEVEVEVIPLVPVAELVYDDAGLDVEPALSDQNIASPAEPAADSVAAEAAVPPAEAAAGSVAGSVEPSPESTADAPAGPRAQAVVADSGGESATATDETSVRSEPAASGPGAQAPAVVEVVTELEPLVPTESVAPAAIEADADESTVAGARPDGTAAAQQHDVVTEQPAAASEQSTAAAAPEQAAAAVEQPAAAQPDGERTGADRIAAEPVDRPEPTTAARPSGELPDTEPAAVRPSLAEPSTSDSAVEPAAAAESTTSESTPGDSAAGWAATGQEDAEPSATERAGSGPSAESSADDAGTTEQAAAQASTDERDESEQVPTESSGVGAVATTDVASPVAEPVAADTAAPATESAAPATEPVAAEPSRAGQAGAEPETAEQAASGPETAKPTPTGRFAAGPGVAQQAVTEEASIESGSAGQSRHDAGAASAEQVRHDDASAAGEPPAGHSGD